MLGMSSSQLTFIFFRGVGQPPTRLSCNIFYKLFVFLWISNNLHISPPKMWIWSNNNEKPHEASSHYNPSGGYREKCDGSPYVPVAISHGSWPSVTIVWPSMVMGWFDRHGKFWGSETWYLPSGKRLRNYGQSPFFMGKLTISMAMFDSYFDITRGYLVELVSKTSGVVWDPNVAVALLGWWSPWHRQCWSGCSLDRSKTSKLKSPWAFPGGPWPPVTVDGGTVVIFSWRYEAIKITKT